MERWIFLSVLHRGAMHVHHRGLEKQQPVVSVHIINHASAFLHHWQGQENQTYICSYQLKLSNKGQPNPPIKTNLVKTNHL
jgi:hypothetical protein